MRSESTSSDSFSGPNVSPSSRRSVSVSCRAFLHPVSDCCTGSCAVGAAWCFQRRGAHKCGIDRRRNETVKAAALCPVMTGISAPAIFLNSPDDSQLARQKRLRFDVLKSFKFSPTLLSVCYLSRGAKSCQ